MLKINTFLLPASGQILHVGLSFLIHWLKKKPKKKPNKVNKRAERKQRLSWQSGKTAWKKGRKEKQAADLCYQAAAAAAAAAFPAWVNN